MKMPKFLCLFPLGTNIHLKKDVGMIPYYLQQSGKYQSFVSFYEKEEKLEYLKTDVKGLGYQKLKRIFNHELFDVFLFLLSNFKRYDAIMMIHPSTVKMTIALFFKCISFNRLKFYFKLDLGSKSDINVIGSKSISQAIFNWLAFHMDVISVETRAVASKINNFDKFSVKYIPNGFDYFKQVVPVKEKIILTVGRIGTEEKNTEMLLEAFAQAQPIPYKLYLVGPIEPSFFPYIERYKNLYPDSFKRIVFVGNVNDSESLRSYYASAEIFVLSSRYEGFPLVFPEAIANGCYIISTDFPAARDITNEGEFGSFCASEDTEQLANLIKTASDKANYMQTPETIQKYAFENFQWSVIVNRLAIYLK